MKKIIYKNKIVPFSLSLLSIFLLFIPYKHLYSFYALGDYPEPSRTCLERGTTWDQGIYLIDRNPTEGKIVLKVENRNKDSWHETLLPISEANKQFKTCVKGVIKYPSSLEKSKALPERSKGFEISIGIQRPLSYTPIARMILNIELYASKFTDDSYNLDSAIRNIAENYSLIQESDESLRLTFRAPLGETFDTDLPFYYEFVRLNDKELKANQSIEFVSDDQGKTWKPVISNNEQ